MHFRSVYLKQRQQCKRHSSIEVRSTIVSQACFCRLCELEKCPLRSTASFALVAEQPELGGGFVAGVSLVGAMASDLGKATFYRDDEIVVDRDGIPHYTGVEAGLMKDYRRRVLFTYSNLEGEGKDETEDRRDLQKKQQRFAKRLLDNLHGVAWEACRDLIVDNAKLRAVDGYKHVLAALQTIEKTTVVRQNEAFDKFFKQCYRRKGQSIDEFLRQRKQDWSDLTDLSDGTSMTDDLKAYFLLEHINLPREDRRQILLANNSVYTTTGFEKTMRISFYDVHEREKSDTEIGREKDRGSLMGGTRRPMLTRLKVRARRRSKMRTISLTRPTLMRSPSRLRRPTMKEKRQVRRERTCRTMEHQEMKKCSRPMQQWTSREGHIRSLARSSICSGPEDSTREILLQRRGRRLAKRRRRGAVVGPVAALAIGLEMRIARIQPRVVPIGREMGREARARREEAAKEKARLSSCRMAPCSSRWQTLRSWKSFATWFKERMKRKVWIKMMA